MTDENPVQKSDESPVQKSEVDTDLDQVKKDRSYAPSSGRETEQRQDAPHDSHADTSDAAKVLPGTGGPDDVGDVEVDPDDIHLPREEGAR